MGGRGGKARSRVDQHAPAAPPPMEEDLYLPPDPAPEPDVAATEQVGEAAPDEVDPKKDKPEEDEEMTVDTPRPPVSGALSDKPLLDNEWGDIARTDAPISYHDDGPIGCAVKDMGADARMDVDGEPLANVVGKLATDVVMGRVTAQEGVDAYKALRDRLPEGSDARRQLDRALRQMDAPIAPAPVLPDRVPEPLTRLVADLNKVPLARAEPDKELDKIRKLAEDFKAGARQAQGRRLIQAVEQLSGARHESYGDSGKFEIDRAIKRATEALRGMPSANLLSEAPRQPRDVKHAVQATYAEMQRSGDPHGLLRLADLRARLETKYSRAEVDAALKDMSRNRQIDLAPGSNTKALTQADRDAALRIGTQEQHLIAIYDYEQRDPD